jgi:hypothetical protein|tara:strand:+ start:316 stop:447 length:132 start_codon:yes stop_codon:yes gene_type:complete
VVLRTRLRLRLKRLNLRESATESEIAKGSEIDTRKEDTDAGGR